MRKQLFCLTISIILLFICACSPVKIFSDAGLTEKTGIKYYTAKPYLLIERENESSRVVKATVIYLPDLSSPQYMSLKDGPGSRKMDLKLTDGTINTFGMTSDTKIAETTEALAALISKSAGAISDLSTLKNYPGAATVSTNTELYEIVMTPSGTTLNKIDFK